MCEPGQFEELLQALALEQERLLRRADEEHQAWRRTLQESFRCLTQRELAQEGASEVFAQLLDVRPGDQPILPEDIDPVPICLDCLDCLDSEKKKSARCCLSRSLVHRAGVHLRNRWQSCEAS